METEPTTDRSTLRESASTHQAGPDTPPSEAVIDAIAAESSFDALELADEFGPLYDVIDPSALDSLFQSTATNDRCVGSVTFEYAGFRVGVDQTGCVELVALE